MGHVVQDVAGEHQHANNRNDQAQRAAEAADEQADKAESDQRNQSDRQERSQEAEVPLGIISVQRQSREAHRRQGKCRQDETGSANAGIVLDRRINGNAANEAKCEHEAISDRFPLANEENADQHNQFHDNKRHHERRRNEHDANEGSDKRYENRNRKHPHQLMKRGVVRLFRIGDRLVLLVIHKFTYHLK